MDSGDRKFYMMWGLVIILLAVAGAIGMMGQGALAALIFFGGIGIALIIVAEDDGTKFYGGVGFLMLGILIFGVLFGLNIALLMIALAVVIGLIIMWHGLRGDKK